MAWVLYRLKYWLALCTNDEWPWICTVRLTASRPHFLSSMYQQKFKFRYRYCLSHWSNLTHQQFCQSTSDFSCNVLYIPIILCMPLSLHTLTLTDCVKNRSSLNHFISIFLQFFFKHLTYLFTFLYSVNGATMFMYKVSSFSYQQNFCVSYYITLSCLLMVSTWPERVGETSKRVPKITYTMAIQCHRFY